MAKAKQVKLQKRQDTVQQPTPPMQEDDDDQESDVEINVDGNEEDEISETEEELARAVFGDSVAFREGLKDTSLEEHGHAEEDGTTGLEGLDDAQLFFTDTGAAPDLLPATAHASDDESEDGTLRSKQPPAWEDSDDERTMVSLASVPRLRKLRRTEAEDMVTGKDYARRLRKQFELLHPAPNWAKSALQRPAKKKRRLSENDASEVEDVYPDEMDLDDDDLPSAAPLSQLLQGSESLVRQAGPVGAKKRKLRSEVIDIQRQKDLPGVQPSAVTSLSFHPTLPLLLSSGPSATLYLHHLAYSPPAPTANPLLTSLHIRGSELTTTAFHPFDSRIFLSARRRYFHIWNLSSGGVEKISRIYGQQHEQKTMEYFRLSPDGQYMALLGSSKKGGGVVNILDATSMQWKCQVRIESRNGVADFAWWRNSAGLCIIGKNGEVSEWSVAEQRIVARWQDEGAVGTTTLALGGQHELTKCIIGNDRWIAIGSSSGIVNVYDRRAWFGNAPKSDANSAARVQPLPEQPKPTKTFDHLTTPTSQLAFSHDGQIMAMASKWKRDSMRLVHLPSCTVFKNWPTSSTPLGRITGVAFAAGDVIQGSDAYSALAVANEQGKIRLWEIR